MKKNFYTKFGIFLFVCFTMTLQNCKVQKGISGSKDNSVATVSYEKDILPVMQRSCTPCHFPDQGRVKMLDNYEATRKNINGILYRVQLPAEDKNYMPFKSKKPALTEAEIGMFKEWLAQDMPR